MTNTRCLDAISISHSEFTIDGTEYVVTSDAEELPDVAFAYLASEISEESERYLAMSDVGRDRYDYSEQFCSQCSPEHDRDLAIALAAREEIRIHEGGSCNPVLTQAEYDLVVSAAQAVRS